MKTTQYKFYPGRFVPDMVGNVRFLADEYPDSTPVIAAELEGMGWKRSAQGMSEPIRGRNGDDQKVSV